MSSPEEKTELLVAIAKLETKVEAIETEVKAIRTGQQTQAVVPVQAPSSLGQWGGVLGVLAAAYTAYSQASGKA